jgi:hypothetical protein
MRFRPNVTGETPTLLGPSERESREKTQFPKRNVLLFLEYRTIDEVHKPVILRVNDHRLYRLYTLVTCSRIRQFCVYYAEVAGPPLWSSGQSSWVQIQRSRVRFQALSHFLITS